MFVGTAKIRHNPASNFFIRQSRQKKIVTKIVAEIVSSLRAPKNGLVDQRFGGPGGHRKRASNFLLRGNWMQARGKLDARFWPSGPRARDRGPGANGRRPGAGGRGRGPGAGGRGPRAGGRGPGPGAGGRSLGPRARGPGRGPGGRQPTAAAIATRASNSGHE